MAQFISHIWGLSEDRAVVADYQFQYGNNIDHRSNSRGIVLSKDLVDLNYPWTGLDVNQINGVSPTAGGAVMFFQSNGEIYMYNGAFGGNFATYTTSTNKNIQGASLFTVNVGGILGAYMLYVAQSKIHRSTPTGGSFTEDAYSFTPSSTGSDRPVFVWNDRMYFGAGSTLMYLDNQGAIGTALTFNPDDRIVSISGNNDLLRIYITSDSRSYVKLWWGTEDTADYTNPLGNIILYSATGNNAGNDLLVSNRGVFECNGYNASPILFQSIQPNNTRDFSNYINGSLFDGKFFYFGGSEKGENTLFVYGKTRVNANKTLSSFKMPWTYAEEDIRGVYSFGSLTIITTKNKAYSFIPIGTPNYSSTGEIVEPTIYGSRLGVRKRVKDLRVGYDLSNGYGGSIEVYARKEINGTWVKLGEITDSTVNEKRFDSTEFGNINMTEFFQIELKFVLKSSTDKTKTPMYQDAIFTFDEIVD